MAGSLTEDYEISLRPSAADGMLSEQRCTSGDSISEWRSSEQVENGTTSTSPPYWDTDDECGTKPSDLYGRFTWKIENFSTINKRELRSNVFEVGGYKWYILIYPQGCDVCNHLSLFLCVANHDKLLPGWSHFAQFTIAVVNKDPKNSKYSDTLHRFWKKEHDWGWKKFMELSKIYDGFVVDDTLVIKAQVQVIRERADRPFRCLDRQYRRELVRVYLSNVEQICRRFVNERIGKLSKLIEDKVKWSSFSAFWLEIDTSSRWRMSRDKTDSALKEVVKHFFIEKEVTSTLVMDSLYSGLKALELQSKKMKGITKVELEELPAPLVCVDNDLFMLGDDVIPLIERVVSDLLPHQPFPSKDEKCLQNRTKDGSVGDEFNKDSIERDEKRLMELGRRTIEIFVLVHIFSSRIEVSYEETIALKRQEELIREEEAAGLAENELKSKRAATEKERRAKKKQAKQKRYNRKVKDKGKNERSNKVQETIQQDTHFSSASVELVIEKIEHLEDVSDTGDDVLEVFQSDLDYRYASPTNWDTDASEIHIITEAGGTAIQNRQMEKRSQYVVDDSSSTCSTDSVPSPFINGLHKGNIWPNNIPQSSPNRGRSHQSKETRNQKGSTDSGHNPPSETTRVDDHAPYVSGKKVPEQTELEPEAIVTSKNRMLLEKDLVEKEETSLQTKRTKSNQVDMERHSSASGIEKKQDRIIQQPKQSPLVSSLHTVVRTSSTSLEPTSCKGPESSSTAQSDQIFVLSSISSPLPSISLIEAQKPNIQTKKNSSYQENAMLRPSTAPLTPAPRSTAANSCQTIPLLSRSVSAAGRLGADQSPSAPNYIPHSYMNAIIGKNMSAEGAGFTDNNASSGQYVAYSQTSSHLSSMLPAQVSAARRDQMSVGPGLTFGCLKPEVIHIQQQRRDDCYHESSSSQAFGSNLVDTMEKLDIYGKSRKELLTAGVASMITPYQVQGTMADEFPHLDIINDLLDDDQNVGLTGRAPQHAFSRQYTLPGNLSTTEFTSIIGSGQYDQSEQYCEEGFLRGYGASNIPLHGLSDGLLVEYPPYACSRGQFKGLIRNHWPYGDNDISMLRWGNGDATGYSYQLQDYIKRKRNRSLYRHSDVP